MKKWVTERVFERMMKRVKKDEGAGGGTSEGAKGVTEEVQERMKKRVNEDEGTDGGR